MKRVKKMVIDRIYCVLPHKISDIDRDWFDALRVSVCCADIG